MYPDRFFEEVLRRSKEESVTDKDRFQIIKKDACIGLALDRIPTDADVALWILANDLEEEYGWLLPLLPIKRTRTLSGVAPVAVMTSPADCPHGKCICCPGGTANNTPQSYTGQEPAALRAGQHAYDPYSQVVNRLEQLGTIGHSTEKVDLIIMGGTFTARDADYQRCFVKGCLDGLNETVSPDLETAQAKNESAPNRCIGMTLETRPDWFKRPQIDLSLTLGATRVELGVQTVYDDVLDRIKRGHTVRDSIEATRLAKDSGLKVCYHMMPGLPGSDHKRDVEAFRTVFEDPSFRPDMMKIYPTLVVKGTGLYDMWKRGEYQALDSEQAAILIADIKELVPPWLRIQRIQRDIPAKLIEAGVRKSNLRQLAQAHLKARGKVCRCIRCREAGHNMRGESLEGLNPEIKNIEYDASGGTEAFISLEDCARDVLVGFLRLRFPSDQAFRPEVAYKPSAIVRELKVFGTSVPLGAKKKELLQHKGFGKRLMSQAEDMARQKGCERILVNSGIGVREYYKALGYDRVGVYMGKDIEF